MSAFDQIQETAYGVIADQFGDDASWTPSEGNQEEMTAKCLFRDPTTEAELGQVTYSPDIAILEYYATGFPGLKESVDAGNTETVTRKGIDYLVRAVTKKYDGKTMLAVLQTT